MRDLPKGGNSESGRLYEHMTSDMAIKKLMSERNRLEKEFYKSAVGQEVEREVDEWLDEHPDFNDEEAKKHEEYLFGKYPEYKDFLSRLAQLPNLEKEIRKPKTKYEAYRRLAGEVESRNVQKRMGMSEEERRNSLAEETEDVARKDQIFLYDNLGESASKKKKSLNTAAQNSDSVNTTAISSDFVAKIATLKERYNNRTSKKTRGFITDISTVLELTKDGPSHYRTFLTPEGEITIRISNHNSKLK